MSDSRRKWEPKEDNLLQEIRNLNLNMPIAEIARTYNDRTGRDSRTPGAVQGRLKYLKRQSGLRALGSKMIHKLKRYFRTAFGVPDTRYD
jgi:hypothetical protein